MSDIRNPQVGDAVQLPHGPAVVTESSEVVRYVDVHNVRRAAPITAWRALAEAGLIAPDTRSRDFHGKYPAKSRPVRGVGGAEYSGPGPWLDLIREANGVVPGTFGAATSTGDWWAGGYVEEYPGARVIFHPDGSVSVVAKDAATAIVLTAAEAALAAAEALR